MDTNGEVTEAPRVEKPETEGMSPSTVIPYR
jgi:hypothetical protein